MLVEVGFLSNISIHAPAWGATIADMRAQMTEMISIHAPAWGATVGVNVNDDDNARFQSTRPRGARLAAILLVLFR